MKKYEPFEHDQYETKHDKKVLAIVLVIITLTILALISEWTGTTDRFIQSFACTQDDVNGDGQVNITDLSVLASRINNQ